MPCVSRWSALVLSLALALAMGCSKGSPIDVPEQCNDEHSSSLALRAWNLGRFHDRSEVVDHAAACMVQGCSSGVNESCEGLAFLCMNSADQKDASLSKRGACALPGVVALMPQPPTAPPVDAGAR